jgi:hypothetical protein
VARSVRNASLVVAGALALAGCTTTQHEAQRERLDSARQRAALESTRVTTANTVVTATSVAEVRADGKTAFVVTIGNRGHRAVTDLPISVGYTRASGASAFLNSAANLNYFESHLPAVRPGKSLVWVFTTDRTVPSGSRAFARIGLKRAVPALLAERVNIGVGYRYLPTMNSLTVHLTNSTSVPQYQLQVYAYAKRDGHYVGAANATVMNLGAGTRRNIRLGLVGHLSNDLRVQAIPTILQ